MCKYEKHTRVSKCTHACISKIMHACVNVFSRHLPMRANYAYYKSICIYLYSLDPCEGASVIMLCSKHHRSIGNLVRFIGRSLVEMLGDVLPYRCLLEVAVRARFRPAL